MNQTLGTNSSRKNRIQNYIAVVLFLISFSFLSLNQVVGQFQTTVKPITKDINSHIKGYQESLPVDYASNPTKKYPLIIFIHGKAECGNGTAAQLPRVLNVGIGYNLRTGRFPASFTVNGETNSFIVLAPQITTPDYVNSPTFLSNFVAYCKKTYRVDEARVYVTGLSMGAGMLWRYAGEKAAEITGIVPICGSGSPTTARVTNMGKNNLAVWATHNSKDPTLPASSTRNWVAALQAFQPLINPRPILTIFEAATHDAWSKTYDPNFKVNGKNIYEWMLSNKKGTVTLPVNEPPVANAGAAQTITLPTNSVTLSGSGTTSAGTITSYLWAKTSGGAATITTAASAKTTITGLVAGTYTFTLTVTNTAGLKSTANVVVTVKAAQAPTANAGAAQTITLPTNSVTLSGSGTTPAGTITSYLWVKTSGGTASITTASSAKTTVTGLVAGTYKFNLTVTNTAGLQASATVTITVKAAPSSGGEEDKTVPIANAGADKSITLPTSTVTLDGSASKAQVGRIISYTWSKVSGGAASIVSSGSSKTSVTGLVKGTYVFSLFVISDNGKNSKSQVKVVVNEAPDAGNETEDKTAPISDAGADKTITLPTSTVTLDGSASRAQAGRIISYTWRKVSGPAAKITSAGSAKTSITGLVQGTYTFSLLVIADNGKNSADQVKVVVNAASAKSTNASDDSNSSSVTADAGSNKTLTLPTNSVTLDGSASVTSVGRIISYSWSKVSGGSATLVTPNAAKTSVSGLAAGSYVFSLFVIADNGQRNTATVNVTVNAAGVSSRTALSGLDANSAAEDAFISSDKKLNIAASPNPVLSDLTLSLNTTATGKSSVIIYNLQGSVVLQEEFMKDNALTQVRKLNLAKLSPGIYLIRVNVAGQLNQTLRIVKQ